MNIQPVNAYSLVINGRLIGFYATKLECIARAQKLLLQEEDGTVALMYDERGNNPAEEITL